MRMDIRIPIGLLFALIGLLLLGYGLLGAAPASTVAPGWNLNATWGGVMLIFGSGMLWLARRASVARGKPSS